jgi:glycoprotein endo-alpha-1,2-mannosidase
MAESFGKIDNRRRWVIVGLGIVLGLVNGFSSLKLGEEVTLAQTNRSAEPTTFTPGQVPRMVLTFYYPWYGNPEIPGGSGRWSHWEGVNLAEKKIGSSTNFPLLGPYDSQDRNTIRQHCRWSVEAGIHAWIVSWWGHGHFTDKALERILEVIGPAVKITIYYETVPRPQSPASAAEDILKLLRKYGDHPAWLKVEGKPVLFIYGRAIGEIGVRGWKEVIAQVNKEYPGGVFFHGDRFSAEAAAVFDGLHTYNTAGSLKGRSPDEVRQWCEVTFPKWVALARDAGKSVALTVIPGYDDTKVRKPGLVVERLDGKNYGIQWEAAIAAQPDWILITSFNEWHEGSEIEPSLEHKHTYLWLTREWATKFVPPKPLLQP